MHFCLSWYCPNIFTFVEIKFNCFIFFACIYLRIISQIQEHEDLPIKFLLWIYFSRVITCIWRSLICVVQYFALSKRCLTLFLCVELSAFPRMMSWEDNFAHWIVLTTLSKISYVYAYGFILIHMVLFYIISSWLYLMWGCHNILIIVSLPEHI